MKYILMMTTASAAGSEPIFKWPQKDIQAHIAFMHSFNAELQKSGEFASAEGLAFPNQAKLVRAGKNGEPVTDGVFPESKEFLMGYWIVDVESPERAYALAARASSAPGPGGAPLNMAIEVREVMGAAPQEFV